MIGEEMKSLINLNFKFQNLMNVFHP